MKIKTSGLMISIIALFTLLIGGCSLNPFNNANDRRSYFPENSFVYIEADMRETGKLDELANKCVSLKGFWPLIKGQIQDHYKKTMISGFDFENEFVPLMRSDIALAIQFNEKLDDPIESVMFLGHAKIDKDGGYKALTEKIQIAESDTVKRTDEKIGDVNMTSVEVQKDNKKVFLAFALVNDDEILFSNNTNMLRDAILRKEKKSSSLLDNKTFKETFDSVYTDDTVISAFIDYEQYVEFTKKYINVAVSTISDTKLQMKTKDNMEKLLDSPYVTAFKGTAVSLNIAPKGVNFKTHVFTDRTKLPENYLSETLDRDMIKYVPKQSLIWYYGRELSFVAGVMQDIFATDPNVQDMFEEFEKATKISIEKDIMNWMKDEYIFALLPASPDGKTTAYRMIAIFETKDKAQVLESWKKLEILISAMLLKSEKNMFEDTVTPNKNNVRILNINPDLDIALVYGYVADTDYLVISDSLSAIDDAIEAAKKGDNIMDIENYKDIVPESEYVTSFGINMDKILNSSVFLKKNAGLYPFRNIKYLGGISKKTNTGYMSELNLIIQKK